MAQEIITQRLKGDFAEQMMKVALEHCESNGIIHVIELMRIIN